MKGLSREIWTPEKSGPPGPNFSRKKCPPIAKTGPLATRAVVLKMACSSNESSVESDNEVDLVDAVYLYLTEGIYPNECSSTRKRSIRKKSKKFIIKDGVLFFKKKKKNKVGKGVLL